MIAKLLSQQYKQLYTIVNSSARGFDTDQMQTILIHAPSHIDLLLDLQANTTPIAKHNS